MSLFAVAAGASRRASNKDENEFFEKFEMVTC